MRKWIFATLAVAFVCVSATLLFAAAEKKDAAPAGAQQLAPADRAKQEKDILIANINGLRNQEVRVAILQQLLNEEVGKLRNLEAVFADQYKLDVEKFRKGLYRYDEKSGKFVEQKS